ncbi:MULTISPECIES: hypothetical protein [unclassified Bradyrhizobium]|uniref:hypothetical protein n=1 Tax=unclassified Bradyrhizobium TaxID=2631580 RepID=UPI00339445A3
MATTTNIFNALSNLSQSMQLQLTVLALSGSNLVSNEFTEEADRLGLTPKGREKKEQQDRKCVARRIAGQNIFPHRLGECGDIFLRDPGTGTHLRYRAVEGDLRDIAFSLPRRDPLFEGRISRIGYAVFDSGIEPS